MDLFYESYYDALQEYNNKNYLQSLKLFGNITLSDDVNDKYVKKVNEYVIKSLHKFNINDINIKYVSINNKSSVFDVIQMGNINVLKSLTNNSAIDWIFYNEEGITPLHKAIICGDINSAKLILKSGGKINQPSLNGNTSLEIACMEKDPNTIQFLINNGANINKHNMIREIIKNKSILTTNLETIIVMLYLLPQNKQWMDYDNDLDFLHSIKEIPYLLEGYTNHQVIKLILYNTKYGKLTHCKNTIYSIIKDEFQEINKYNDLICPCCPLDNILLSLIPLLEMKLTSDVEWLLNHEILSSINIFKQKILYNKNFTSCIQTIKTDLLNKMFIDYIVSKICTTDYIDNVINMWIFSL
jgi:ankyrin repeat protein